MHKPPPVEHVERPLAPPAKGVRKHDEETVEDVRINVEERNPMEKETYSDRVLKIALSDPEPPPKSNDSRPIWELVVEDMKERDHVGRKKYGTPLQAGNGRAPMIDAYQEALDLCVYLRQAIEEGIR